MVNEMRKMVNEIFKRDDKDKYNFIQLTISHLIQGVKKGVLEICDMILINKYDGNMKKQVFDEFINIYEI